MKIKYDLTDDKTFKRINESMGIALYRDSILRNRKLKYTKYLTVSIIEIIISVLFLSLMIMLTNMYYCILSLLLLFIAAISLIFVAIKIITPLCITCCLLGEDEGEIEFDEKGLSFILKDEINLKVGWSHIKGVIIGDYSINFITDSKYYFYIDKGNKNEILKALKKYKENIIIVR